MADADEEIVTFRLAPRDRSAIQRLVDRGEFRNRSDFLRYAVKTSLRDLDEPARPRAKLDLDLEGVQLPDAEPAGSARAPRGGGRITRRQAR
jgi:Arc/MetJ-type ribon-helix-helix transcriptional regulator